MIDYITTYDIANEVRMMRDDFHGALLIVEGETADFRLYGYFIDQELCRIIPSKGRDKKGNAIGALGILEKEDFPGVLVIVDADFWRLEGKQPMSPNLFTTDTHDLETMILESEALEKLLTEYGSVTKIRNFTEKVGKDDIRQALLDICAPIGYLRWNSQKQSLSLTFNELTFSRFMEVPLLILDVTKLIKAVKNKSQRHDLDDKKLRKEIVELANPEHNLWDVCCGHDLVCILSLGLRNALGSRKTQEVRHELLEMFLRGAYEFSYFSRTKLYQSLKTWEDKNPPFFIFPRLKKSQTNTGAA